MSGYLRRLIDTAAARGDSVHPATGSIFSPHQTETSAPLHSAEDAESNAASAAARARSIPGRRNEPRGDTTKLHAPLLPPTTAPVTFSTQKLPHPRQAA